MKKRLVSLMLAGLLTLTLTACGGQKSDSPRYQRQWGCRSLRHNRA